jgi:hypothetical protein
MACGYGAASGVIMRLIPLLLLLVASLSTVTSKYAAKAIFLYFFLHGAVDC